MKNDFIGRVAVVVVLAACSYAPSVPAPSGQAAPISGQRQLYLRCATLDTAAPTATTSSKQTVNGITQSGGNPWKPAGTWEASPQLSAGNLVAMPSAQLWLDTSHGRVDLRIEAKKNGTTFASGEASCASPPSVGIMLAPFMPVTFTGQDVLSVSVFVRTCSTSQSAVGVFELLYDATVTPSWISAAYCTPATCSEQGFQCGPANDGCGATLDCGACAPGQVCSGNACTCPMGGTLCGGQCVQTAGDPMNCGACGNACGAGQSCAMGQCVSTGCGPATCPNGCCMGNTCVPHYEQDGFMRCGAGGEACHACPTFLCGMAPDAGGGVCGPGIACDSTTCPDGCCNAGKCIPTHVQVQRQMAPLCGSNGMMCQGCPFGLSCQAGPHGGLCVAPDAGSGCTPQSCGFGCCQNGTCVQPMQQSNAACGSGGVQCASCFAGSTCQQFGMGGFCVSGCNNSTCPNGCCFNGTCLPAAAQHPTACGSGGNSCISCGAGACQTGPMGGFCTATQCNPMTCPNGCCSGNTCIQPQDQHAMACGSGGAACLGCAAGATCQTGPMGGFCVVGQCDPMTCPNGCCSGTTCIAGPAQTAMLCGTGGSTCSFCPSGSCQTSPMGGFCAAPACDAMTCPLGCCAGGTCLTVPQQSPMVCGSSGAACAGCPSGTTCGAGNFGGVCVPSSCNAMNCPTGCCLGDTCIPGGQQHAMACGTGGGACQVCTGGFVGCQLGMSGGSCVVFDGGM